MSRISFMIARLLSPVLDPPPVFSPLLVSPSSPLSHAVFCIRHSRPLMIQVRHSRRHGALAFIICCQGLVVDGACCRSAHNRFCRFVLFSPSVAASQTRTVRTPTPSVGSCGESARVVPFALRCEPGDQPPRCRPLPALGPAAIRQDRLGGQFDTCLIRFPETAAHSGRGFVEHVFGQCRLVAPRTEQRTKPQKHELATKKK